MSSSELCQIAGVSGSGYYRWKVESDKRAEREQTDYKNFLLIKKAYHFRGYAKGSKEICMRLKRMGITMNRKKVQRLMKKYNLFCPIRKANPYRRMAKALRTDVVAPNYVNRHFRSHGPRKVLLTDITYLRLNQKHVYLSVIKDAFTMQILSYQLSESLEVDFVLETIKTLMKKHSYEMDSTVWIHSDQGCHYTSVAFRKLLQDLRCYNIVVTVMANKI